MRTCTGTTPLWTSCCPAKFGVNRPQQVEPAAAGQIPQEIDQRGPEPVAKHPIDHALPLVVAQQLRSQHLAEPGLSVEPVVYWTGIYFVVRRLSGFRWSRANLRLAAMFAPGIAAVFVSWYFLPRIATAILGATLTLLTGIYSLKTLCTLVPLERLPKPVRKLVLFFRLAPPNTNG